MPDKTTSRPEAAARTKSTRLYRLLRRMIDTYSPSGREDGLVDYLHGFLKRHGLPVRRQAVDDDRDNLLVLPPDGRIELALIGHVDTVTAYDLDSFGFEEEGDKIIGLGAADMKSGCAAMIEAFLRLWEADLTDLPVALALVVGEEESGDGAEKLVEEHHFPWALIGEPTDLKPCLSHYGYLEMQLTARGKRRHASLAGPGQSAVEEVLETLLQILGHLKAERPEVVYNIRDLYTAGAGFVVPEACEAWLDLHLPPRAAVSEVAWELEELAGKRPRGNDGLESVLRSTTVHHGYALPDKGPLAEALRAVYAGLEMAWEPEAFASHSDANVLWAAGVKPVLLGCGRLDMAHAPEEEVDFPQVVRAAEIYHRLVLEMFGRGDATG